MQLDRLLLLFCLSFFLLETASAQDSFHGSGCDKNFAKHIQIRDKLIIETKPLGIVTKNDFAYTIELKVTKSEIKAYMVTSDVRSFRWNDRIMLVADNGEKRMFTFIERSEPVIIKQELHVANVVKFEREDLEWLAQNSIGKFRLMSMSKQRIYPFALSPESQEELKILCACVYSELIK